MAIKTQQFTSLSSLAKHLRRDCRGVHARKKTLKRKGTTKVNGHDFVLLFAHNGVGKTRLSMEFKQLGKTNGKRDTLYFNAFTEDLFDWENDFDGDTERMIRFKSKSNFFNGLKEIGVETTIRAHLHRYADFNFDDIDFDKAEISFFREELIAGKRQRVDNVKISRGEENLFIWCFFLAILQLAIDAEKGSPYDWVKYVYIDDPISSLDEHNTIALASDLAGILRAARGKIKVIISTHHGLFFNIMFNELKGKWANDATGKDIEKKAYILHRPDDSVALTLQDTGESPFLHHVAALLDLQKAARSGKLTQYHCNSLRSTLEKVAVFFGRKHFSTCLEGNPKRDLYARFLNIRSHAKYSVYDPESLHASERKMFREILKDVLTRFPFDPSRFHPPAGAATARAPGKMP